MDVWTPSNITSQNSKMKFDIPPRTFAMPCDVHELSPVKFYSDGKRWKRFKIGTITPSVSAGKCGPGVATILSAIICSNLTVPMSPILHPRWIHSVSGNPQQYQGSLLTVGLDSELKSIEKPSKTSRNSSVKDTVLSHFSNFQGLYLGAQTIFLSTVSF